jgi:hypothetical protein
MNPSSVHSDTMIFREARSRDYVLLLRMLYSGSNEGYILDSIRTFSKIKTRYPIGYRENVIFLFRGDDNTSQLCSWILHFFGILHPVRFSMPLE